MRSLLRGQLCILSRTIAETVLTTARWSAAAEVPVWAGPPPARVAPGCSVCVCVESLRAYSRAHTCGCVQEMGWPCSLEDALRFAHMHPRARTHIVHPHSQREPLSCFFCERHVLCAFV